MTLTVQSQLVARLYRNRAQSQYRTKVPTLFFSLIREKRVEGQKASVTIDWSLIHVLILFAVLESKGKLRGKTKAQRKKEEREKKSTVKTQGDELKDNLADNDDSSSTTTETSNPDVETNIKEVH